MSIEVECPGCGKVYRTPETAAGKKIRCKACEAIIQVPDNLEVAEDPYEAFEAADEPPRPRRSSRTKPRERSSDYGWVTAMAIILMGLATITMVGMVAGAINTVVTGPPPEQLPPPGPERDGYIFGFYAGGVGGSIFILVYNALVILGSYHIVSRGSSKWARAAAIMACVPCCSPCFIAGIPFGIAALIGVNQMIEAGEFSS